MDRDRSEGWRTFFVWGVPLYVNVRRIGGDRITRVLVSYGDDNRFSSLRHSRAGVPGGLVRTGRETIKAAFDDLRHRIAEARCRHFAGLR